MLALAAVALSGVLVAFIIALIVGVLIYAVGVYVLHAPQPAVGLIAFLVFLIILLYELPGGVVR